MSERYMITETVFHADHWGLDGDGSIPTDLNKVADWVAERLAEIPEEYRASAKLEIESEGGYEGEHHATVSVTYCRAETDREVANREMKRAAAIEDEKRRLRARLMQIGG